MADLTLALLGPSRITYRQRPLTQFRTKTVQPLLVYLACQPEAHQRDHLMTLFWPEELQTSAWQSLRQTLYLLKQDESHWPEAIALYRGDFLTDIYLPDWAPFEEWAAACRADLCRQVLDALANQTERVIAAKDYEAGEVYARRQLELENLRVAAHRQLIRILMGNGRRPLIRI